MKQSQSKDTIGKIVILAVLLLVGEGVFNWGGYWVLFLLLPLESGMSYWIGFSAGILVSQLTTAPLGLASGVIVALMFVFSRLAGQVRSRPVVVFLFAVAANYLTDRLSHSNWSYTEIIATAVLVFILASTGYLKEELRLRA